MPAIMPHPLPVRAPAHPGRADAPRRVAARLPRDRGRHGPGTCAAFVNYLRAACTHRAPAAGAAAGAAAGPPNVATAAPVPVIPDETLVRLRLETLKQDLPERYDQTAQQRSSQDAFGQAITAFDSRTRSTLSYMQAAAATAKTKTPTEKWGAAIGIAHRIHSTVDDSGLPLIYFGLAEAPKGRSRITLQLAYNARAQEAGSASAVAPIAVPAFDSAMQNGQAHGTDCNDFKTGVSIFQCGLWVGTELTGVQEALQAFDAAAQGSTGTTWDDQVRIKSVVGVHFPADATELLLMAQRFSVLEDVHKGPQHSMSLALRDVMLRELTATLPKIIEQSMERPRLAAQLGYAIHLEWYEWSVAQSRVPVPTPTTAATVIPVPDFARLFRDFRTQRWVPPELPRQ